jgi:hypothetical protein
VWADDEKQSHIQWGKTHKENSLPEKLFNKRTMREDAGKTVIRKPEYAAVALSPLFMRGYMIQRYGCMLIMSG